MLVCGEKYKMIKECYYKRLVGQAPSIFECNELSSDDCNSCKYYLPSDPYAKWQILSVICSDDLNRSLERVQKELECMLAKEM